MLPKTFFAALLFPTVLSLTAALPPVPATPRDEAAGEIMHGEKIGDPYRWLEGSGSPELAGADTEKNAALDAEVRAWSEAQNARTRACLDAAPGRAVIEKQLRELFKTDSLGTPIVRGEKQFFSRRRGNESNRVLYVRDNAGAPERELLNVNTLYPDGRTALAWTNVDREGKRVAFGLYNGGDENTELHILDVETGDWLADKISRRVGSVGWLPGGDAFIYRNLADVSNPYSGQIRFHRIGLDSAGDKLIFEQYKTGPFAATYGPDAGLSRDGRWMILSYSTGTADNDLWIYDFAHWQKTGELKKITISEDERAPCSGAIRGDTLYFKTNAGAPNGRLYKIDLKNPARENRIEIVPENPGAVLENFSLSQDFLVLCWKENARRRYELRDRDGKFIDNIALPGIGSGGLSTNPDDNTAYLSFSSFNEPPSIYTVNLATRNRTLYFRPDYAVNTGEIVVKQEFYKSKDGTSIPLFIARRKDVKLDGTAPTILYGYGGFAIAMEPRFTPAVIPWINAGGVYAVAGIRGGDEFGEPWHRAGMLEKKQNVFDDFIGAAEYLIAEKYTSPAHLGIRGGSNGGLLTGAVLVQRPELFGAVCVGVPLLDMLRYQHFLMARYWVPEYGDPARATDFAWIKKYSPYHNIKRGVKYPATFIDAGENDSRVHPLHARKMAARLQAETGGDPEKSPILLWIDFDSGHGGGKSFDMTVRDNADIYLFFAKQLGLDFEKTK